MTNRIAPFLFALLALATLCPGQTVPGYRLFADPFASVFGTPGYAILLGERQDTPAAEPPAGYEVWLSAKNAEGYPVLIVRPAKAQPATVPVVAPPPQPPVSVPVRDPRGVYPPPGADLAPFVAALSGGQILYLARGGEYRSASLALRTSSVSVVADPLTTGPNPRVVVARGDGLTAFKANDLLVRSVDFTTAGDPSGIGLRFWGCKRVRVESCRVTNFVYGIAAERWGGADGADLSVTDCDVSDNWNPKGGDSSGIYVGETDGVTVERCKLDHNGWRDGVPVKLEAQAARNHNVYLAGSNRRVAVRHNQISRPCSHGLQARAGGDVVGNTFTECPIGMSYGLVNGGGPVVVGGVTGKVDGNTFEGTRPMGGRWARGWAIEIGNVRAAAITNNTFRGDPSGPNRPAIYLLTPQASQPGWVRILALTVAGNRGSWRGGLLKNQTTLPPGLLERLQRDFAN